MLLGQRIFRAQGVTRRCESCLCLPWCCPPLRRPPRPKRTGPPPSPITSWWPAAASARRKGIPEGRRVGEEPRVQSRRALRLRREVCAADAPRRLTHHAQDLRRTRRPSRRRCLPSRTPTPRHHTPARRCRRPGRPSTGHRDRRGDRRAPYQGRSDPDSMTIIGQPARCRARADDRKRPDSHS